jgi:hypothetical protein
VSGPAIRRALPLIGLLVGWVIVCFFAVAPVSVVVAFLAGVAGRPGLVGNTAFAATLEALVHLGFAVAVFRAARVLRLPRWYWLAGPLGYLMALGLYVAVMLLLGDTMAVPRGQGWVFVAADVAATALGAWAMVGRRTPGDTGTSQVSVIGDDA